MKRVSTFMLLALLTLFSGAAAAGEPGLEELGPEQLERQVVGNTLAPLSADPLRQLETLETVEDQQRFLPDVDYVATPDTPQMPVDTGASAAQQQFLQGLINTLGSAAESAR